MDGFGGANTNISNLNIRYAISGMDCRCSLQEHLFSIVWGATINGESQIFLSYLVSPGLTPIGFVQPIRENYGGSSYVLGITVSSADVTITIPNKLGSHGLYAIGIMAVQTV